MKFLVITQDLRISGTSEGIVSRSFIGKLRSVYKKSIIDVYHLKHYESEDRIDLLPIDNYISHFIPLKIPWLIIWINKFYWRIFHKNLKSKYVLNKYRSKLKLINYDSYDNIFIRSCGQDFETILAAKGLQILKKSIINFHDPYPVLWDTGSKFKLTKLEVYKLIYMWDIVKQSKCCISPARMLSEDMEHLYGSDKQFFTLPHQYCKSVFDFRDNSKVRKKQKEIQISYHGAIQFTRNIDVLLDSYLSLIKDNIEYKRKTEFVLRIKGNQTERIKRKYSEYSNIIILGCLNFSNSACEQKYETDIAIILENCSPHSNILIGKAPFLASLQIPILSISPMRSELQRIVNDKKYIANYENDEEVKEKLEFLIKDRLKNKLPVYPFNNYFDKERFKSSLIDIIKPKKL